MRHGKAYVEEIGRQVERQRIERYQAAAQPLQGPHVFERRRAKARQIVGPLIEAVKAPVGDNRRIVVGALATWEIGFVLARFPALDGSLRRCRVGDRQIADIVLVDLQRELLRDRLRMKRGRRLVCLADQRLRATPEQLRDAFGGCADLHPVYRRLIKLTLDELRTIEDHLTQLDQQMADLLAEHHEAVRRLAEVPGLGVDSAQQIIAEVGATAATFPSPKHLASWIGACPGNEESAGVNYSHRCPKGNRQMRRVLNQAANAAVKAKGTIFAIVYRRLVPRLGHAQAIGAIAHRLCRLIWKILHEGIRRHSIRRFSYGVFFKAESDRVVVIAVMHTHRDPNRWRRRPL